MSSPELPTYDKYLTLKRNHEYVLCLATEPIYMTYILLVIHRSGSKYFKCMGNQKLQSTSLQYSCPIYHSELTTTQDWIYKNKHEIYLHDIKEKWQQSEILTTSKTFINNQTTHDNKMQSLRDVYSVKNNVSNIIKHLMMQSSFQNIR